MKNLELRKQVNDLLSRVVQEQDGTLLGMFPHRVALTAEGRGNYHDMILEWFKTEGPSLTNYAYYEVCRYLREEAGQSPDPEGELAAYAAIYAEDEKKHYT